ncbi:MAG: hypothetical protein BIFFINMI_03359 [Phycisphaerae bacterium]|nr:hypothetical protein [Phycisphaerae bacterium]
MPPADPTPADALREAITHHPRLWRENRFVYPVCSRRSGGISIGVNLNPDKACNFDCIYCQVDRSAKGGPRDVDLDALRAELDGMLAMVRDGSLFEQGEFRDLPEALKHVSDVAFSGDGEPAICPQFVGAISLADELVTRHVRLLEQGGPAADRPALVLITNATVFERPAVREGLEILHRNRGEIWGKLDAGTDDYYRLVERTGVPLARVLENLTWAARRWPITIQSLFMRIHGHRPDLAEIEAFCDRLGEMQAAGGRIGRVQVYTLARRPAEGYVRPLSNESVDAIVARIRQRFAGLDVRAYYGLQT